MPPVRGVLFVGQAVPPGRPLGLDRLSPVSVSPSAELSFFFPRLLFGFIFFREAVVRPEGSRAFVANTGTMVSCCAVCLPHSSTPLQSFIPDITQRPPHCPSLSSAPFAAFYCFRGAGRWRRPRCEIVVQSKPFP